MITSHNLCSTLWSQAGQYTGHASLRGARVSQGAIRLTVVAIADFDDFTFRSRHVRQSGCLEPA